MTRTASLLIFILFLTSTMAPARSFTHFASCEQGGYWVKSEQKTVETEEKATGSAVAVDDSATPLVTFKGWGTCFNELGWDALQILPEEQRNDLLKVPLI